MDILTTVSAGYAGLKFAKDSLQVALGLKIEGDVRAAIVEALTKLGSTQDTLFELREEMFRLQSENERLRQDLKSRDDWETRKAQYQLVRTEAGAMIWAATFEPKHFICPVCFEKREGHMLQPRGSILDCPACKASYQARIPRDVLMRVETDFDAS